MQASYPTSRKWARYRVDIPVCLVTQKTPRIATCEGRGSELNGGGLTVDAAMDLALDEQVAVEFTPPCSGEPVIFRCFVRNRNGNRYGLEFITENDSDYIKTGELQEGLAQLGEFSAPKL